jgi:hypothetical protein
LTEEMTRVIELLRRRAELSKSVLALTEDTLFSYSTTSDDAMEADSKLYHQLYEQREQIVNELTALHNEIGEVGYTLARESSNEEAAKLYSESRAAIRRIVDLDEEYMLVGKALLNNARDGIKRIKQNKSLSAKYNDVEGDSGFLVDNKN